MHDLVYIIPPFDKDEANYRIKYWYKRASQYGLPAFWRKRVAIGIPRSRLHKLKEAKFLIGPVVYRVKKPKSWWDRYI